MGIGTDTASVMVGINSGVFKVLKEEYNLPHLILNRCVPLYTTSCFARFPRVCTKKHWETYNWFWLTPSKQDAYKEVYETINVGEKPQQT